MARRVRSAPLEHRSNRLKLPVARKPIFERIGRGVALGYRRNATAGTWVVRVADGKGGAWTKGIGTADDYEDSNGCDVLTFWEAQERAKQAIRSTRGSGGVGPVTIAAAAERYLQSLEARNARSAYNTRRRLERLFLPTFGSMRIIDLTRTKLEAWRDGLIRRTNDAEQRRRSQDTANRVLSIVKALLNHATSDPKNGISDDSPWRLVRPFQRVARARAVHFTTEEAKRLIAAIHDPFFADLVRAGFLTGARYGELTSCRVRHFDRTAETLWIPQGKTGARTIILQPAAVSFFSRLVHGRGSDAPLLPRTDGSTWRASHQLRPMKSALARAGLSAEGSFYALRHSYISRAIEGGVPLNIIAENCGTSIRMIETTYAKVLASKRRDFIAAGAPIL